MAQTKAELISKLAGNVQASGRHVTDEQVREALARENDEFVRSMFDPTSPAPDLTEHEMQEITDALTAIKQTEYAAVGGLRWR